MRLDSHTHMYDEGTIQRWKQVVGPLGITHYVAIMKDASLHMIDRLDEAGARGIPFHWIDLGKKDPFRDVPVAGYKLHPRQTVLPGGGLFNCTPGNLRAICERAAREGRPLLFHTDGDDPNPASVSMLAQLCREFPKTTIIAAHMGVYTQERFITQYSAEVFEAMIEPLWQMNIRLVIDTPNLYGDTTKFGMDYPWRSRDPMCRFKAFKKVVQSLSRKDRRRLVGKLFVGTDFPHFSVPGEDQSECLDGTSCVRDSHLGFQVECMREAFGDIFDEDRMVMTFFALLPDEFQP